ncbi:MAG: alpha/beta hydrolase [Rhodospirillaceae bacterium]|nr:alpha/beta hydrolase [Rhodospirillaceae bacterium]
MWEIWKILTVATGVALMSVTMAKAEGERTRELVRYGDGIQVDLIAEGKGPLIVLLPSGNRDSEDFDDFAVRLAKEGFRVLRPQPRGMGQSRGPMQNITMHDFARDVAAAIESQKAGAAVVLGHAYGAWIARMTAADHPKLVRGVILAATSAKVSPPGLGEAYLVATDPTKPEVDRLKALQFGFFAPGHDPRPWLTGWHPDVAAAYSAANRATRREEWWPGGTAPMLDLQGELDPWKPRAVMNEIKDEFGDRITVAVVAGASHALIPEKPDAVVAEVVKWVRQLPK